MFFLFRNTTKEISSTELKNYIDNGKVAEISVNNDIVSVKLTGEKTYGYEAKIQQNVNNWYVSDATGELSFSGYVTYYNANNGDGADIQLSLIHI